MSGAIDPRPFARLPGGIAPLGYRNFALYWAGFVATNTGKWIETTGAVWVAYELSRDPLLLGLLGIVRGLPTILLTPFAGVIADRVDQRRLILVTQATGLVTSLMLGLLLLAGRLELWQLYVQVAVQSAISAADTSGRQALFPRLVPRARMVESVTLVSAAARTAGLVGPAIGGVAIATLGLASPFLLNAATFLLLMGALGWMRGVQPASGTGGRSFRADLSEGFRYMWSAPVLRGLLQLEIVFSIFQVNPVITTIIAREVLNVGPEGLGILLSALAGGALLGTSALIAFGATRRPGRFVAIATVGYAGAMVVYALSRDFLLAGAALVLIGIFDAFVNVSRNSIMQLGAPARMRGRIMANQGTIVRGVGPLAQTQSGAAAGILGGPLAIAAAAGVLALVAALVALRNRPLWAFTPEEPEPEMEPGHQEPAEPDREAPDADVRSSDPGLTGPTSVPLEGAGASRPNEPAARA
jgi:MFS family permease